MEVNVNSSVVWTTRLLSTANVKESELLRDPSAQCCSRPKTGCPHFTSLFVLTKNNTLTQNKLTEVKSTTNSLTTTNSLKPATNSLKKQTKNSSKLTDNNKLIENSNRLTENKTTTNSQKTGPKPHKVLQSKAADTLTISWEQFCLLWCRSVQQSTSSGLPQCLQDWCLVKGPDGSNSTHCDQRGGEGWLRDLMDATTPAVTSGVGKAG